MEQSAFPFEVLLQAEAVVHFEASSLRPAHQVVGEGDGIGQEEVRMRRLAVGERQQEVGAHTLRLGMEGVHRLRYLATEEGHMDHYFEAGAEAQIARRPDSAEVDNARPEQLVAEAGRTHRSAALGEEEDLLRNLPSADLRTGT